MFIAPASRKSERPYKHLQKTVENEVDETIYQDLTKIDRTGPTRLWGVTSGKSNHWSYLQPDDWVLFYVGYNLVEYAARVFDTEYNPELGQVLWQDYLHPTGSDHPEEPWNYLIHLQDPIRIEQTADDVRDDLGYSSNYDFPGFTKIADRRVRDLEDQCGSLDNYILKELS